MFWLLVIYVYINVDKFNENYQIILVLPKYYNIIAVFNSSNNININDD